MVVVQLKGGLGNQMFQYAIGRSLSLRFRKKLYLDLSHLHDKDFWDQYIYREYELDIFTLKANLQGHKMVNRFFPESNFKIIQRLKEKWKFISGYNVLFEDSIIKENYLDHCSKNIFLIGYWQSEFYFKNNIKEIVNDFTFKKPLPVNEVISEQIKRKQSVSIHVRRGDYISNNETFKLHGTCSIEYYKKAIRHIVGVIPDAEFFVFSDDPEWVKENLNIPYTHTIVNWNLGKNSYEDMRLMSLCKHNIIANSSFSWWAAWLNQSFEKVVIAPIQWFADTKMNDSTDFLIPSSWIRM